MTCFKVLPPSEPIIEAARAMSKDTLRVDARQILGQKRFASGQVSEPGSKLCTQIQLNPKLLA